MAIKTEQIREVYFERVFNLGNYETFRLGLHATVTAGQTVESIVQDLDEFTVKMRNKKIKERN
jgi:proteasome assembly chaperone (PAC2) family protein